MTKLKINKAYNEFRFNLTPWFWNQMQVGNITRDHFDKWFDLREATFFAIMDKAGM